jgi:hypothetical protein
MIAAGKPRWQGWLDEELRFRQGLFAPELVTVAGISQALEWQRFGQSAAIIREWFKASGLSMLSRRMRLPNPQGGGTAPGHAWVVARPEFWAAATQQQVLAEIGKSRQGVAECVAGGSAAEPDHTKKDVQPSVTGTQRSDNYLITLEELLVALDRMGWLSNGQAQDEHSERAGFGRIQIETDPAAIVEAKRAAEAVLMPALGLVDDRPEWLRLRFVGGR